MYVNIEGILIQKRKSLSWLSREVGCNYSNLCKVVNNQTKSINFDLLEKLCLALGCGVADILIIGERGW